MAKNAVNEAIKILKELLLNHRIRINKIVLFGSYSKNNAKSESDIDLAVISPDFTGKDTFERAGLLSNIQWELTRKLMIPFDLVAISPDEWRKNNSLIVSFVKDGKVLVGR